jgi:hypothetical protein
VTHTHVCQTEQMFFLRRNSLVVVLPRANRGSILRSAPTLLRLYVECEVEGLWHRNRKQAHVCGLPAVGVIANRARRNYRGFRRVGDGQSRPCDNQRCVLGTCAKWNRRRKLKRL